MSLVVFAPTIPVPERAKTVHALDHAATVMGSLYIYLYEGLNRRASKNLVRSLFFFVSMKMA
jgi:hypothetical protein